MNSNTIFIDIETTGLSPETSALTILGAKTLHGDVRQWFNETGREQKEILSEFLTFISSYDEIVTFNGTTFDLPYLAHKCSDYKLSPVWKGKKHVDLYQKLKKIKHLFPWKNLKQKTLESYLNISRRDNLSSRAMIKTYQDFLDSKDDFMKEKLLLHNQEDLIGLEAVYSLLSFQALLDGNFKVTSSSFADNLDIHFKLDTCVPTNLSVRKDNMTLCITHETGIFSCPVLNGQVYHYYPDTKDYYYLDDGNVLLPKAMGQTIPRSQRHHPAPDQCRTYFCPTTEFLSQTQQLYTLCAHNITYILRKDTTKEIEII
ncbi:MAG: ribonuclease H-like domain-containing protein [Anaerostipes sp.]|nr:ribonuclease H-like domain-containing protein [Anaerostipes sp.]